MKRKQALASLTSVLIVGMAMSAPARSPDDDCGLLCSADDQRKLLSQLQAPDIETYSRTKAAAYRVLAVNGWNRPEPALTFTRAMDGRAQVEVRARYGRPSAYVEKWSISSAQWDRVVALTDSLPAALAKDRADLEALEHPANGEIGSIIVCADGWSFRIESMRDGRSSAISGSSPDVTEAVSAKLVSIALEANDDCEPADAKHSAWTQLQACLLTIIER